MRMRHEFRVGDVISEIGVPRLYVVVEVKKKAYYYSLQEIDKHGKDLYSFYGAHKSRVHERFVKVGRWRSKTLPSGVRNFDVELDVPSAKTLLTNEGQM